MNNNKKILVVEDNDFVRMQIGMFLKAAGYDVVEATDGQAAESKLSENPQLIIADVMMEPVGGFAFIRSIRNKGVDVPVILVTGDQNNDLLEQSNKLGVASVLIKPVKKDRLISMVQRTLQHTGNAT
jgi:two-component system chemotaxis response regulator CheY